MAVMEQISDAVPARRRSGAPGGGRDGHLVSPCTPGRAAVRADRLMTRFAGWRIVD